MPSQTDRLGHAGLEEGPFGARGGSSVVHVAAGPDPYACAQEALAAIDLAPTRGLRVLLKPNAGRVATPGQGVTTAPAVVAAAIDAFREAGAIVSVGESPIYGVKTMEAFEATGIAAVARERACPLIDLDERRFVRVAVPEGRAIDSLSVAPEVLEHDVVVSMPVMKTHMHTGVTLSVKNMKGCLWRRTKVELHMLPQDESTPDKPLNVAIADLSRVLRPHLSLIDGTTGMEGLGPSAGKPKALGVVVAGAEPFAADAVACALMGVRGEDVPHLRIAAERGYGIIDLGRITVTPDTWRDLARPFAPPPDNLSIEFPGVEILDEQSCSACQSTLLLFLKRYGAKLGEYFPSNVPIRIAIGKGHESLPEGTLCIGNCTVRHRDRGVFVSGCPPVASQILKAIMENAGESFPEAHEH